MNPWNTPSTTALIVVHYETCQFEITGCFLKLRKSMVVFKKSPNLPLCFSLYIRPWCHTLSNASDISKNVALTSVLSPSRDWYTNNCVAMSFVCVKISLEKLIVDNGSHVFLESFGKLTFIAHCRKLFSKRIIKDLNFFFLINNKFYLMEQKCNVMDFFSLFKRVFSIGLVWGYNNLLDTLTKQFRLFN